MAHSHHEELVNQVQKRINQEPTISDPSRVSVTVEKRGMLFRRRSVLLLDGTVGTEAEKERVETIVDAVTGGSSAMEIENHLVVPLV